MCPNPHRPLPRFFHTKQLLNLQNEIEQTEAEHAAVLFTYEASVLHPTLKDFLNQKILSGEYGRLAPHQLKTIVRELFCAPHAKAAYLDPLRKKHRLGYTDAELAEICRIAKQYDGRHDTLLSALGFSPPPPCRR